MSCRCTLTMSVTFKRAFAIAAIALLEDGWLPRLTPFAILVCSMMESRYILLVFIFCVGCFSIILLFLVLKAVFIWNPIKEASHEFSARDKKHEIRLQFEKVTCAATPPPVLF